MGSIAFLFPGQGSQAAGMGREMARSYPCAAEVFTLADSILGFPLSSLCWEGPEEELRKTINTQPAVVATSIACFQAILEEGVRPDMVAGHSVGEYSALVAAGVLELCEALTLVKKRATLMEEAGKARPGTMAAVIGLELAKVEEACMRAASAGVVEVANLNSPDQIVISGEMDSVRFAMEEAMRLGAKKVIPLKVGAAFHCTLMRQAAESLASDLKKVEFRKPGVPVVVNSSGKSLCTAGEIREALEAQLLSRVLWEGSIREMRRCGVDTFLEVGPGTALGGMVKRIDKNVRVLSVQDPAGVLRAREELAAAAC